MVERDEDAFHVIADDIGLGAFEADVAIEGDGPEHVLVIVHGIRSNGSFVHDVLATDFLRDARIKAVRVTYARKSTLSLLLGWPDSEREKDVRNQLVRIGKDHPGLPISLLCHSNGTRLVSEILDMLPFEPRHIILAGSICRMEITRNLLNAYVAVNEVGTKDPWPLLAEAVRPGRYQGTGSYGFNRYPVVDRFFPFGHSGAFTREHLERYVVPIIVTGQIKPHGKAPPWWLAALPTYLRRTAVSIAAGVLVWLHR